MKPSPTRACALAFVVAFTTLTAQILFHRIISAKLLNNYAFLVISLTMLGFACSGALLSRSLTKWLAGFNEVMALWASLFALSTLGATLLFYHAPMGSQRFLHRGEFVAILLRSLPCALLFAIPFIFAGLLLGLLLSSPELPSRRVYCWDLLGSALGALAVAPAISLWGVEKTLLAVCGVLLAAVFALARPARTGPRLFAAAATLGILLCFAFQKPLFTMRYPEGSMLAASELPESGMTLDYVAWDPVARIEVSRIPPPDPEQIAFPSLIGGNRNFLSRFKRIITQNNFAFTYAVEYDGKPESLAGIEETIYSAAYVARPESKPRVAIIGVGGGFDILTALRFGAQSVLGIEVNGATLDILTNRQADYFRAWTSDPRVRLVHDEGRHFLAGSPGQFDVIQLSGVDSYSGTPGAAHVFSENYLYTTEALELYFSKLSPGGILNLMRLEHTPPREMLRALTTAVAALRRAGVAQPSRHIAMVWAKNEHFTAMLVKKTPFDPIEEQRLAQWASTNRYLKLAASPGWEGNPKNFYQTFLGLGQSDLEEAYYQLAPYNIVPTTDNKPFFFNFSRWSHLLSSVPLLRASVPVMEITLLVMFCLISLAALLCVWLPLRALRRREPAPAPRRHALIFAGTALAYLAVEVGLLQKFGLFLGHPNYALSVVLAGLLFGTGLGALGSTALVRRLKGPRFVGYLLAFLLIIEVLFAMPALHRHEVASFGARVVIVLLLVLPLGVLMGVFVPTALDQLKKTAPGFVPWAWGINGIFSVLAPVLSIAFSMTWGIDALLLAAIPIYLAVGWLYPGETPIAQNGG